MLVIAVAASLSVFFLERIEDVDARQDHALGDVAAAVNQLSAAEWEGIAEKSISTLLKDRVNASLMDIETGLRALNAIAPESSASWQKLSGLIDRYRASQADETALVQAGRFADAEVVDRSRVDPAFRDLDGYTRELRAASQSDAERQAFFTRVSSVAAILLSLAVVALVVRRSSPRRPKLVARG